MAIDAQRLISMSPTHLSAMETAFESAHVIGDALGAVPIMRALASEVEAQQGNVNEMTNTMLDFVDNENRPPEEPRPPTDISRQAVAYALASAFGAVEQFEKMSPLQYMELVESTADKVVAALVS